MINAVTVIKGMRMQIVWTRISRRLFIIRVCERELIFLTNYFRENTNNECQTIYNALRKMSKKDIEPLSLVYL